MADAGEAQVCGFHAAGKLWPVLDVRAGEKPNQDWIPGPETPGFTPAAGQIEVLRRY